MYCSCIATFSYQYYEKNGNSKVYSKSPLGAWVCSQRSAKNQNSGSLTPKRIELLNALEFLWSGIPDGWTKPPKVSFSLEVQHDCFFFGGSPG